MPIKSVADIRLTAASDGAWAMAARAREEGNKDKLEADALRLEEDTVKEITDIITDNKPLIDAAYNASYKQAREEQRQRINNLKQLQEEAKRKESIVQSWPRSE